MNWSISTHNTIRLCQRQFFFAHLMASHNARALARREAHQLKQLQHIPQWQSSIIHNVLALYVVPNLQAGRLVDVADLVDRALEMAQRQFSFSENGLYREQTKKDAGDNYCALFAHEHQQPVPADLFVKLHSLFDTCFANLAGQTELLKCLAQAYRHEAECSYPFKISDAQVQAKIDLLCWRDDAHPIIVDWKVAASETSNYERQLAVYALAVFKNFKKRGISPESITLIEVNLLANQVRHYAFDAARLEQVEAFIYRSVSDMEALHAGKNFDGQDIDAYEIADKAVSCQYCNFVSICACHLVTHQEIVPASEGQLTLL